MTNELISAFLILLTTLGGAIGLANEDKFTEQVNTDVNSVNNVLLGVEESQARYQAGEIGIGQFRADWQDAQIFITGKFQDTCRDTDLSPKQKELNEKYKIYLLDCNQAVKELSEGNTPEIPQWDR